MQAEKSWKLAAKLTFPMDEGTLMSRTENIQVIPGFDLEEFMNLSHETRLSSEALEHFGDLWNSWLPRLQAQQIKSGQNSWLAIWLPEEVENEVDEAWAQSPGEGYLINALAQYMCMSAVYELLPQIADRGCAPAPKPHQDLKSALSGIGLGQSDRDDLSISRRYAIVTYYPFRGGCEICSLQENCPKNRGESGFASLVLDGYERGKDD